MKFSHMVVLAVLKSLVIVSIGTMIAVSYAFVYVCFFYISPAIEYSIEARFSLGALIVGIALLIVIIGLIASALTNIDITIWIYAWFLGFLPAFPILSYYWFMPLTEEQLRPISIAWLLIMGIYQWLALGWAERRDKEEKPYLETLRGLVKQLNPERKRPVSVFAFRSMSARRLMELQEKAAQLPAANPDPAE